MSRWMKVFGWMPLAIAVAAALLTSGCKSAGKAGSAGFASVVLKGNTPGQIAEATVQVFEANGYETATTGWHKLVFEKEGSKMSNISYGNWLDTSVWARVRVAIEPVGEATYRLQCQAYMVRDRNGTTEEEIKVSGMRSGKYKKMLEEVAKRLSTATPPFPEL